MIIKPKHLLLAAAFCSINALAANSIIAVVDDELITSSTVAKDLTPELNREQKRQVVNQYIDRHLQLKQAGKLGIQPRAEAVNNLLESIAKQNQLTLAQLRQVKDFDQVLNEVQTSLILKGLRQVVLREANLTASEAELTQALAKNPGEPQWQTQIRLAQIVIASVELPDGTQSTEDSALEAFLVTLKDRIQQGEAFGALAKLYSQDPSYQNGGLSDWLDKSKLPDVFANIVSDLAQDTVSKPFKVGQTWRLLKIDNERQIDQRLQALKAALLRQKQSQYFGKWTDKLREDVYIDIFENKL